MWLRVDLRTVIKKTCVYQGFELCAQSMLTILSSIVNLIWGTYMIIHDEREFSLWQ